MYYLHSFSIPHGSLRAMAACDYNHVLGRNRWGIYAFRWERTTHTLLLLVIMEMSFHLHPIT